MKESITTTGRYVCKSVDFSDDEAVQIPWLIQIHEMMVHDKMVAVEPAYNPAVEIGRSFASHLKNSGIMDGYNPVIGNAEITHFCKLNLGVNFAGSNYRIVLELCYGNRSDTGSLLSPSRKELAEYLFGKVVEGRLDLFAMEMRVCYVLKLHRATCFINDMELVI